MGWGLTKLLADSKETKQKRNIRGKKQKQKKFELFTLIFIEN